MTTTVAVQVRGYLVVFGALLVLTLTTVAASYLDLSAGPAVALGLAIALVKAGLVAAFFMHLSHERALIYASLVLTAVLFLSLIGLTLWSEMTHPPGTQRDTWTALFSPRRAVPAREARQADTVNQPTARLAFSLAVGSRGVGWFDQEK